MTANYCDECGEELGENYAWGGPCNQCSLAARRCKVCGDQDCDVDHSDWEE